MLMKKDKQSRRELKKIKKYTKSKEDDKKKISKKKKMSDDDIKLISDQLIVFILEKENILRHICTLINRAEVDDQSRIICKLIQKKGGEFAMNFLQSMIVEEVENTMNEGTLFRDNNIVVALLSAHARTVGHEYLVNTIGPLLKYVKGINKNLEIDPQKLHDQGNVDPSQLEENKTNLREVLNKYLEDIFNSLNNIPSDLRKICYFIQEATKQKFPNSLHTCIGGFYFLRFACPAIIAPDGFGIVDEPLPITERRPFVLISKAIQGLANEMKYSEEYMAYLHGWMDENGPKIKEFFDKIIMKDGEILDYSKIDKNLNITEIKKLVSVLKRNIENLHNKFTEDSESIDHLEDLLEKNGRIRK